MKFRVQLSILILAFFCSAVHVRAAVPELVDYRDANHKKIYVALYDGIAVELRGCTGDPTARALLQLESGVRARESDLITLKEENQLGQHPVISCGEGTMSDSVLPEDTPIWADLTGSEQYYLAAPSEDGLFYAVPMKCEGIRSALAMRQRTNRPGVLQGMTPPPALTRSLTLDCGFAPWSPAPQPVEEAESVAIWKLYRFDTFLLRSESVALYVAHFMQFKTGGTVENSYLPIYRVDGRTVSEILNDGNLKGSVEAGLRKLFSIAQISPPGAVESREALREAATMPFTDLCLTDCATYEHQHAFLARPESIDRELTRIQERTVHPEMNILGYKRQSWNFALDRTVAFARCGRLSKALGLRPEPAPDWATSIEAALRTTDEQQTLFQCMDTAQDLCVRRLTENGMTTLHETLFQATGACANSTRLRLELPETFKMTRALVLIDSPFKEIEIRPASWESRSVIQWEPSNPAADEKQTCYGLDSIRTMITTRNLQHLTLRRIDILPTVAVGEAAALQVENGTLALDRVNIGTSGNSSDSPATLDQGIRLCKSQLYLRGGEIKVRTLALNSIIHSQLLVTGVKKTAVTKADIVSDRYGIQLYGQSSAWIQDTKIKAQYPLVLKSAALKAERLELLSNGQEYSDALRMHNNADEAVLTISTARKFRCLGYFLYQQAKEAKAKFILPGNDLRKDNENINCGGHDNVSIVE